MNIKLPLTDSLFYPSFGEYFFLLKKNKKNSSRKLLCLLLLLLTSYANALPYYTRAGGFWGTAATWSHTSGGTIAGTIPGAADDIFIEGGFSVTNSAVRLCNNLSIAAGSTLTIGGFDFTVNGTTSISGNLTYGAVASIKTYTGMVSINTSGIWPNSIHSPVTFRGGIATSNFSFSNFICGTGFQSFTINAQTISETGLLGLDNVSLAFPLTNNPGGLAITLTCTGSTIVNSANKNFYFGGTSLSSTLDATAAGNTEFYYAAGPQTVKPTSYQNLKIQKSSVKTISTTSTVNGILFMEETGTASAVPTFGASASLQYNKATARNTGAEWPVTFAATGGVTIGNTCAITLTAAKVLGSGVSLTISSGNKLTPGTNALTFGGNFINNGTVTSGSFGVIIIGGVSYATNDYASYNGVGAAADSGGEIPSGYIAPGHDVFAKTIANGPVIFNNDMRADGGLNKNGQFFKPNKTKKNTTDRSRIWLNMTNDGGTFKQILIGYVTGATNGYETKYDGVSMNANTYADFYSICEDKNLVIQGRAVPFDESDSVPLGYRSSIQGESSFDITIANSDGVLANQGVFLEDKLTGTWHDLRASKYTFTTVTGIFKERFMLHFANKTLGTDDFKTLDESLVVTVNKKIIKVFSAKETIEAIRIFDLSGKLIYTKETIDANEFSILNLHSGEQTLLVKVSLENGSTVTRKVIFN